MVRRYRRKRHFSTTQRVLVYLSCEDDAIHDGGTFTQEGIAEATLSGRSTVTKCLDRLERQGLIFGERAHVKGHRVRKTIYRLSRTGWRKAETIRKRLSSEVVEIRGDDAGAFRTRVSEIPKLYPTRISLTSAVALVNEGVVDLTKVGRGVNDRAFVVVGPAQVGPRRLVGRTKELTSLRTWFASSTPVLAVTGIAGIGKTSLVSEWVVRQGPKAHVSWHLVNGSTTFDSLLSELAGFLSRVGRKGLNSLLLEGHRATPSVIERLVVHELDGLRVLFVLDDANRVSVDSIRQVSEPLLRVSLASSCRLLFITRQLPTSVLSLARELGLGYEILRVGPLDPDASTAILRSRGVSDPAALEALSKAARGHPLMLNLAARSGVEARRSMMRFLREEILRPLSRSERNLLEVGAIFPPRAPANILAGSLDGSRAALSSLESRNLVETTVGGGITLHPVIRDFVLAGLDEERLKSIHWQVSAILLKWQDPESRVARLHHLFKAGRPDIAAQELDRDAPAILDSSSSGKLISLIRGLDSDAISIESGWIFSEILADGLRIRGDLGPALRQYQHAIKLAEASGRNDATSRMLRKVACIQRQRGNTRRALDLIEQALALIPEPSSSAEVAELLRERAVLEGAQGDLAAAAADLEQAIDIATEVSDSPSIARSLLALGTVEGQRGRMDRALSHKLEGLGIAERSGNLTETARGLIHVGNVLAEMDRRGESLEYYERSLRLARLLGNLRLVAFATMNKCGALLDLARYEAAGPPLQDARQLFEILEESENLALLRIYDGQREMGLGRWVRAQSLWSRGLSELELFGSWHDLARSLREVGMAHIDHGEIEAGIDYLKRSAKVAHRLGNAKLANQVESSISAHIR